VHLVPRAEKQEVQVWQVRLVPRAENQAARIPAVHRNRPVLTARRAIKADRTHLPVRVWVRRAALTGRFQAVPRRERHRLRIPRRRAVRIA
jgi:hypothetical protein